MTRLLLLAMLPLMSQAANYSARETTVDGVPVVVLSDAARHTQVSVAPSAGNRAYEMLVDGKNIFWVPNASPAWLRDHPEMCGNPFLAPWANRLDQDAFWANGKQYLLNPNLGNLRRDGNRKPIHGLLTFWRDWKVVNVAAGDHGAAVTSRLEFWQYPDLLAQFPFPHTIEMTYRLADGVLEVETAIENHGREPMPVAVGFHPYFQLHDAPRDGWKVHLAARRHMVLSNLLIPTGESRPVDMPDPVPLQGGTLDDVFTGLVRGEDGKARFSVEGVREKVTVVYGPRYTTAVVYAPPGRHFICFEPMSAITDAFNLAHEGRYQELQSIPAGGRWKASYWIEPTGFY